METLLRQGDDKKLVIQLLNPDNTPAVVGPASANLVTNIRAILFVGTDELARYGLNPTTGYGELQFGTANNEVQCLVTREQTLAMTKTGLLRWAVVVSYVDDDFPDGRDVSYEGTLGRFVQSLGAKLN